MTSIIYSGEMPGHYVRATAISNPIKSNPCALMVDPGPCKEAHLRYFFEKKTKKCKLFYYGGCEGNANNFATELECEQKCVKRKLPFLTFPSSIYRRIFRPVAGDHTEN